MSDCVVLFSGGIDSTTALFWARQRFDRIFPLTFDYGQRHSMELSLAAKQAERMGLPHKILQWDLTQIGGSALTDRSLPIPRPQTREEIATGIPSTYVPFRNGILISLAAAWAEVHRIETLVCGFHVIDSPEYPDTRPEFVRAMEQALNAGTRMACEGRPMRLLAPFINLRKSEIIRMGLALGADYSYSLSCYAGGEIPCGNCSACFLRQKAWEEVGQEDPLLVRLKKEGTL